MAGDSINNVTLTFENIRKEALIELINAGVVQTASVSLYVDTYNVVTIPMMPMDVPRIVALVQQAKRH